MSTVYPSSRSQAASDSRHRLLVVHDQDVPAGLHGRPPSVVARARAHLTTPFEKRAAGRAGGFGLAVEVRDVDRQRHRAAAVEAVHEPEGVPHLVDGLGGRAPGEHRGRRLQAVELGAQAGQGDDRHAAPELGLAVDEAEDGHEEVALRDPEQARRVGRHAGERASRRNATELHCARGALQASGGLLQRVQAPSSGGETPRRAPPPWRRGTAPRSARRRARPPARSGLPAGTLGDLGRPVLRVRHERQRDVERRAPAHARSAPRCGPRATRRSRRPRPARARPPCRRPWW